jgi:hypothetical protein
MSSDSGSRQPDAAKPDFDLPVVRSIEIRRVDYQPPRRRNFESAFAEVREAIELLVTTAGPIPMRALGAALYVGGTAVVEMQRVDETHYRFLAFDLDGLEDGAPIALGWTGDRREERRPTKFRFNVEK